VENSLKLFTSMKINLWKTCGKPVEKMWKTFYIISLLPQPQHPQKLKKGL